MASNVDICNLALMKIAQDLPINSLTESTKAARTLSRVFDTKRDQLLAMHPWPFALKAQALSEVSGEDPPPGWELRYAYPSDCLLALAVTDESGVRNGMSRLSAVGLQDDSGWYARSGFAAFDTVYGASATSIVSDLEEAYLLYVKRVTESNRFPPLFVDALACFLALEIAPAIAGETGLRMAPTLRQAFDAARSTAICAAFNESRETIEYVTPSVAARQ